MGHVTRGVNGGYPRWVKSDVVFECRLCHKQQPQLSRACKRSPNILDLVCEACAEERPLYPQFASPQAVDGFVLEMERLSGLIQRLTRLNEQAATNIALVRRALQETEDYDGGGLS